MRCPVIQWLRLANSPAIAVPMSSASPTRPSAVMPATASRICGVSRTAPPRKSVAIAPLGRDAEAADAYRAALALTDNAAEQKFLAARVTSTQPAS